MSLHDGTISCSIGVVLGPWWIRKRKERNFQEIPAVILHYKSKGVLEIEQVLLRKAQKDSRSSELGTNLVFR